ncbi:MAG: hypothetical protein V4666_04610 [Bacteroidota bacterium]
MKFLITILKKAVVNLGGVDTSEENYIDTFSEKIIQNIPGEKIATIENGGIWTEFSVIGEYEFMEVHIVGKQEYKSFNGAKLEFISENRNIGTLISDSKEIESRFSNVSNRYLTSLSVETTNLNLDFLLDRKAETIIFNCKNIEEKFKVIE